MINTERLIKEATEEINTVSNRIEELENDWHSASEEIRKLEELSDEEFEAKSSYYDELLDKCHECRVNQELLEDIIEHFNKLLYELEEIDYLRESL